MAATSKPRHARFQHDHSCAECCPGAPLETLVAAGNLHAITVSHSMHGELTGSPSSWVRLSSSGCRATPRGSFMLPCPPHQTHPRLTPGSLRGFLCTHALNVWRSIEKQDKGLGWV